MMIQPKKLGSNKKEILLTGDTSSSTQLYNKFTIELVENEIDEDLELAKIYLPNSSEFNYYVFEYSTGGTLTNLIESGLIQVGNTQEAPTIITPEQTKNNIVL